MPNTTQTEAVVSPEISQIISESASLPQRGVIDEKVDHLSWLMNVIVIVLFIGFAGMFVATASMLVDSFSSKAETYGDLRDRVLEQNEKINTLTQKIQQLTDQNNQQAVLPRAVE
jgi:hypothetical protein